MADNLLPSNATEQERALDAAVARVSYVPTPARDGWSPQSCPVELLPWLAWAFSLDEWDGAWSEAQKRAAIAQSFAVHQRKGTIGAVRRALAALGLEIDVVEWWQESPAGEPYTFRVRITVDQSPADAETLANVLDVINSTKNLRSHLAEVSVDVGTSGGVYFGGVTMTGNEITIEPWLPVEAGVMSTEGVGLLLENGAMLITE